MMAYSFNLKREPFAFALCEEVNASYKDLGAVCDAIRYLRAGSALALLDTVASKSAPIPYRRHNRYMGSRHELKGAKGAYPVKAAREVKVALVNALANAENKGMDRDSVFVIHASSTKTRTETRPPSKGSLSWGRGRYGGGAHVEHETLHKGEERNQGDKGGAEEGEEGGRSSEEGAGREEGSQVGKRRSGRAAHRAQPRGARSHGAEEE